MEHNIEASHGEVNVVLAADNSPHSDFAFNYYVKEIHRPGYKLHVIHSSDAWASLHHGEEGETISPGHVTEMKLKEDNKIKQMEEKVTKMLQENKIEGVFKVVGGKDSWHEIIKYQQSVGAIMIVVGSRGLNALRRTFMGSVSDSIVHHANCPVLVCRHN